MWLPGRWRSGWWWGRAWSGGTFLLLDVLGIMMKRSVEILVFASVDVTENWS